MTEPTSTLGIVVPAPRQRGGNRVTALRWARIFRRLGWRVFREEAYTGRPCDVLVALHARRSHASVARFHREHPGRPLVVAATGTDVYGDSADSAEARASFTLASRIVVLQPLAVRALPAEARARARVIYQSVEPPRQRPSPPPGSFDACVVAHLRAVKDPLLAARAARMLPASSRARVVLVGAVLEERMLEELDSELRVNPRLRYVGEQTRAASLDVLARSRMLVCTSRHEGGSNAVSEALSLGVPVLTTAIPGSLGLLGEDYPGRFGVGDAAGLSRLLHRAEADSAFYGSLAAICRARAAITSPARELASWRALLKEVAPLRAGGRGTG